MEQGTFASGTPALETERLSLRPLLPDDLFSLHRILNDAAVRLYLCDDEPVSVSRVQGWLGTSIREFSEKGFGLFGVRPRGEAELIGFCGLRSVEGTGEVELLYGLLPRWWGRGLATEAARACLRHAFREAELERVVAGVDTPNVASARVLEKLGMKPIEENPRGEPEVRYFALRRDEAAVLAEAPRQREPGRRDPASGEVARE